MNNREKLVKLIKDKSFKQTNQPSFVLTSGKKSKYYFNMKNSIYTPEGLFITGFEIYNKIQELNLKPKAIGGLTLGADPIAFATAFASFTKNNPIEAFVVRKEPKGHGLGLQIEGNVSQEDLVIIIDDVVTTGSSTIKAIKIAQNHGLKILCAIALLDRCEENGRENIESLGINFFSILTINDFLS